MLLEGSELIGESGKKYLVVQSLGQSNVWVAVDSSDMSNIVVIKEPGADDPKPWANFQNELVMHELFKESDGIRKQVDRIQPTRDGEPPMLVLEMFETTLWKARTKRPLSNLELKKVMKDALLGLKEVHDQGQVYADLKMPNILVDGFDPSKPSNPDKLQAKLGDLGIVMAPATGKVQPVSYRAPEVYFKGAITPKADIWSWALIYCHLLEAQTNFERTGHYDDFGVGDGSMQEREAVVKHAMANDYEMQSEPYFRNGPLPPNDKSHNHGDQWERLRNKGLPEGEVDFLRWVLRADPRKRPSADDILETGWLDKDEEGVAAGFSPPLDAKGQASMEFDPRRSSPGEVQVEQERNRELSQEPTDTSSLVSSTTPKPVMPRSTSSLVRTSNEPTSSSEAAPATFVAKTMGAVHDALDQMYPTRGKAKRELSQESTETSAGKRAHPAPKRADEELRSAEVSKVTYADIHRSSQPPLSAHTADSGEKVIKYTAPGPASVQRPSISTTNTGTLLSYH